MLYRAGRTRVSRDNGGFVANLNFPGWLKPLPRDHGHGPLALIAESLMVPGRLIEMHEHRNDEIISWVPDGVMRHEDRISGELVIDADHLLVMNAGRSFWHSDRTRESDPPLRMLQILVRPDTADLEPRVQYGGLAPIKPNIWRHLFGPEDSGAPFTVRNRIDCYDIRIDAGTTARLPAHDDRRDVYFYVFTGAVEAGGKRFGEAEQGLWTGRGGIEMRALEPAVVVLFLIDPDARTMRLGTVGDHKAIPRPWLVPIIKVLLALRPVPSASSK